MTLDEIAIRNGTDKATQFTRTYAKPHGYTPHYERAFHPLRTEQIKFLEIGVGGGESIITWLDYFLSARVFGVDIVEKTNLWNTPGVAANPRYTFCQGNQSDPVFWQCFVASFGGDWDVVIDDGSHIPSDILTTFGCLWPHVAKGGLYAIEDLNQAPEILSWIMGRMDAINKGESDIDSITFSKELVIFRKK